MPSARVIVDPPAAGVWNMAVDEALLRIAGQQRRVTLRVYRWEQPTLSLGYFQRHAHRGRHAGSTTCPMVRRASGGGAIIHDREITYSLTAPISNRWQQKAEQWYDLVHTAWVTTLALQGAQTRLCAEVDATRKAEFLCFQRRSAGDLLLDNWKIGGSAQRRHRRSALQHGSLLLDRSSAAPELPGIAQLTGLDLTDSSWLEDWIQEVGRRLGVDWEGANLDDQEAELAADLAATKFGHSEWTLRR